MRGAILSIPKALVPQDFPTNCCTLPGWLGYINFTSGSNPKEKGEGMERQKGAYAQENVQVTQCARDSQDILRTPLSFIKRALSVVKDCWVSSERV